MTITLHLAPALLALAVTVAPSWALAAEPVVTIENFTFMPAAITIHAGTAVTFKNADDIPHSVVMADGSYRSKTLDTDDAVTVPFARAGDYVYFCGLHPHMQGKVTVLP